MNRKLQTSWRRLVWGIAVVALLTTFAGFQAGAAPLAAQATCTQFQQVTTPFDNSSGARLTATATPRCFRVTVPANTARLQVDLSRENNSGRFNVFIAPGQLTTLTTLDQEQVFAGGQAAVTFVLPATNQSVFTIAIVAASGSPRYHLRIQALTRDDAPPPSQQTNAELELLSSVQFISPGMAEIRPPLLPKLTQSLIIGSDAGAETRFPFWIAAPGEIRILALWSGDAAELGLRLYGPPRPGAEDRGALHAQVDGIHPLILEYEVTADDLEGGGQWLAEAVNLNGGSVEGRLDIIMDRHMFAQQLRLDVPIIGQTLLNDGDSLAYILDVPPDAGTLTIEMAGPPEANFDLFARSLLPVLPGARAWRGAGEGAQRTIRLPNPPPGILHILVRSAQGEGNFQLSATIQPTNNTQPPTRSPSFAPGSLRRVDPQRAGDGLNLRTGAGVNYPAFVSIPPNAVVTILSEPVEVDGSPWVRVRYPAAGRSGWVNGNFLLPPAADESSDIFSGDPRDSAFLCDGGFQSDCDFGNCAVDHRLVWGPFCREDDHDGIRPGRYSVSVDGSGRVRAGATDFGSSEALFSLGRQDLQLPASFEFCWPGREPNGFGFETIVTSREAGATVTGLTLTYLGENCTLSALPPEPSGLVAEIVQTGLMSQAPEVKRRLVFEVAAFDAGQGLMDGAGIDNVELAVYDQNGNLVYAKTETSAGYCAFGGGTPDCGVWDFARARNRWPNGNRFTPGPHLLFATVNAQSGEQATVEMVVDLQ